jgi:hypothetical protein
MNAFVSDITNNATCTCNVYRSCVIGYEKTLLLLDRIHCFWCHAGKDFEFFIFSAVLCECARTDNLTGVCSIPLITVTITTFYS